MITVRTVAGPAAGATESPLRRQCILSPLFVEFEFFLHVAISERFRGLEAAVSCFK